MADLLLPGRRGVQPPAGVGVDWTNPLAKDLGGLFDTRAGIELVYNNRASNYTTLLKAARAGVAADFSGTANQQYAHRPGYATTGAMTIFVLMEVDALTNYSAVIAKQQTTTVNIPFEFRLGSAATGSDFNFVRASASSGANSKQTTGSRLSAAAGVPRAIAITVADGLLATIPNAYVDKVKTAFNANAVAGSCTDSAQPVWIGRRYDGATQLDGPMYFVALWNRELSENEVGSLTDNPWQLFRPAQRRIWVPVAGGGIDLSPSGSTHAHTAENVVLTSSTGLTVADASHAQAADNITLSTTAGVDLTVSDAGHAQAAENVALSTDVALTVASAAHAQQADSVVLGALETLTVANAAHAHSADNVTLTVGGIGLTVADAAHAQAAGAPTLSADSFLITADGSHGQIADLVTLSTSVFFDVDGASHAQTADNLTLDGAPTLAVNGAQHAQAADDIALGMDSWLAVASAAHSQAAEQPTLTASGEVVYTRAPAGSGYSVTAQKTSRPDRLQTGGRPATTNTRRP